MAEAPEDGLQDCPGQVSKCFRNSKGVISLYGSASDISEEIGPLNKLLDETILEKSDEEEDRKRKWEEAVGKGAQSLGCGEEIRLIEIEHRTSTMQERKRINQPYSQ